MKILPIGDVHGRCFWKDSIDFHDIDSLDKVVFLGDYVDSFVMPDDTIISNLEEIISLKRKHPSKVILLLGNHDCYYISPFHVCGSGYRPQMAIYLEAIFRENMEHFQLAYEYKNHLFTHAGVNSVWVDCIPGGREAALKRTGLSGKLNVMWEERESSESSVIWDIDAFRGGSKKVGGPLWGDWKILVKHQLDGWHQHVGHSFHGGNIPNYKWTHEKSVICYDYIPPDGIYPVIDLDNEEFYFHLCSVSNRRTCSEFDD